MPICHGRESVSRTMARNSRRLVATEKMVGERIRSRWASAAVWSSRIRSRAARGTASPSSSSARASHQVWPIERVLLVTTSWRGHEVVVGHDVGGKMRQVAGTEGAERIARREVVHFQTDVPGVAVAIGGGELLRHGRVGRDAAVEKVIGKGAEQIGHGLREQVERTQDVLAEHDVGSRRPGVGGVRDGTAPPGSPPRVR